MQQPNEKSDKNSGSTAMACYVDKCCEARKSRELQRQIMDCRIPKNEREWWASRRLETLEKALGDIVTHGVESHEDAYDMQDIAMTALQA